MQKEKRLLWISHCGLQLGSDEFLAFGARIVAGSYDFAAWINECGQKCTVCVRFIRITGYLRLSVANIQADWEWQPFLYIEMAIYDRTHDRYIYIYIHIYTTTTQCKLQNKCSFVCVHISKCLVGKGKTPPAQVADNAHCKCQ